MARAEMEELIAGLERVARISWREASNPDHSWTKEQNLMMAQRAAVAARILREESRHD